MPLTIGMAVYKEPDNVWFTLTALHANHPKVQYLVVDNSPERSERTAGICRAVGGRYVHRPDLTGTSAPRDAVMRLASTPWVMCVDSHIIFETGAIQRTLDYLDKADTKPLYQGPLAGDDGVATYTHWTQPKPPGLWGEWETVYQKDGRLFTVRFGEGVARVDWATKEVIDTIPSAEYRGHAAQGWFPVDAETPPFEIPMLGLGCFLSHRSAWKGFNPLFQGFGGEEGYLHGKMGSTTLLPWLRWRHLFRDATIAPPYKTVLEDHTWNLLVGHRELGIEATGVIHDTFGSRIPAANWTILVNAAQEKQPFGEPPPTPRRCRLLAVWYSDNTAPTVAQSLRSVGEAASQAMRHDVIVSACPWSEVDAPVSQTLYAGEKRRGYDTIIAQIKQAAGTEAYDAVCFMEHDVLYPADYFDRVGDAVATGAPVVSNLDYIGLNATGWLKIRERHEPLHQLTLRWDVFKSNIARAESEAATGRPVVLEPDHDGDRSAWARLPHGGPMPSVHINHTSGRLSSHGEVCYEPIGYTLHHPYWGRATTYWPDAQAVTEGGGCGCHTPAEVPESLDAWFAQASVPSDFHEHMGVLRDLATSVGRATEVSSWHKSADRALAYAGRFTSVTSGEKPSWGTLRGLLGDRFKGVVDQKPTETDLLFIDTIHTAEALMPLLQAWAPVVSSYLVVHCTETYGEVGDNGGAGVLHALRSFCVGDPQWVVKYKSAENHGLIVLSKVAADVKEKPALWRQAISFAKAKARHLAKGLPMVDDATLAARMNECSICEFRALDACSACGCPLEAKTPLATEACPKGKWLAVA